MDTSFVSFLSCRLPNVYLDWLQIHTLPHDVQEEGPAVLKWVASCLFVCFLRAGIATRYGLDDAAFEPLWGRDFPVPSRPVRGPHNLFYNAYRISFSRLSSQGMALTIHALLAVRIEYGYAIPLPFLCDCMVRDEFLFIYWPGELSRYSDSIRAVRSWDRIPVGARFSAPVQAGPEAHPASYTTGTGSFLGVKRPGCGVNHPSHLVPRLKEE